MIIVITPERWRRLHDETNPACWCGPRIERVERGVMLSHENPRGDADTRWIWIEYPELTIAEA